jgi:putative transcriptional regulator
LKRIETNMTTIKHHPDLSTLMSCAAGSQPEAFAAVMASHIAVCPSCASEAAKMERIGAALFDTLEAEAVTLAAPVAAARAQVPGDMPLAAEPLGDTDVPYTLQSVIGGDLDGLPWKRLARGVWHYPIKLSEAAKGDLRLIKVAPGHALPEHGHGGEELTLVLRGSYQDSTGHYAVGDVADLADDVEHAPVADAKDGCICLIASERPAKFKSLLARIMQPLVGL